ncbi:MAG: outer membrane lipoprotein-sorting protein [Acidobacteria bacterium]|nr:outer membrane lipoprotein-sorting protein [Acidobacteriota bacterium]
MSDPRLLRPAGRAAAIALALASVSLATIAPSSAAPTGQEIAREADRRRTTKSQFYDGSLKVYDSKGKVRDKGWRFWRLGYGGDSKTILQFTSPAEVAGVSLLTVARAGREDEQWMWTPAIHRDRRIAAQEKSTKFLGTDFTYEDLSERVVDDDDYMLQGEEPCDGGACWIVSSTPHAGKKSQYSRSLSFIRQGDYALMRLDLFVADKLRRRLVLSDHRTVQGIVTPHRLVMFDLEKESRTELTLAGLRYDLPLEDSFFTVRSLQEIHAPPR